MMNGIYSADSPVRVLPRLVCYDKVTNSLRIGTGLLDDPGMELSSSRRWSGPSPLPQVEQQYNRGTGGEFPYRSILSIVRETGESTVVNPERHSISSLALYMFAKLLSLYSN
jgi:hypothetical protein